MPAHDRGRSPSAGHDNHLRPASSTLSTHPRITSSSPQPDSTFATAQYNDALAGTRNFNDPSFTQDASQQPDYLFAPTYPDFSDPANNFQPQAPVAPSNNSTIAEHTFLQSMGGVPDQNNGAGYNYNQNGRGSDSVSPHALSQATSPGNNSNSDTSAFPSFDFSQVNFDNDNSVDPSLLSGLGNHSGDVFQPGPNNFGGSLDPMTTTTMQSHAPAHLHLGHDATRSHSHSPSPRASPQFQQMAFQAQNRSRNVSESLDPSSALFPPGQSEWSSMGNYRAHKRTPSDNYSEYSSHSNQASPYLPSLDSFDANAQSSPLLVPSHDSTFNDSLGLQQFTLNENQAPQQSYYSPGHSPQVTAQHQALPPFTAENNFGLTMDLNGQFGQHQHNSIDVYPNSGPEPFPSMSHQNSGGDAGNADQMSPPEINIDYAPPSKNPMENVHRQNNDQEALSPPMRTQSRAKRTRAKSDSYAGAKSISQNIPPRGRSPSLQPHMSADDNLSPLNAASTSSRSTSPATRGRGHSNPLSRNRSLSNTSDREYYLDLADPARTPSTGGDKGRVQKHPATFQCHLCPKRFTRAYNLRSHLRTHTDERPFVCTVCGKAFARQHDRKRHEGLHSGEKKFVCRGTLTSGAHWGCGRRFARADALGRHFRSEAGRVCIKPLLDEEAAERQRAWQEEQQQARVAAGLVVPQPVLAQPQVDMLGNFLPAALLQQYPALGRIDWNAMPQGPPPDEEVYSGRSSYDASSGGEYLDEVSEGELSSYSMGETGGDGGRGGGGGGQGGGAMGPLPVGTAHVGGFQRDYLSDFEGR